MSTVAVIVTLVVVLVVAAAAAWLWGERRAGTTSASLAKMLSDAEGQAALLTQKVGTLEERLASAVEEERARQTAFDSAKEDFAQKEVELREKATAASERVAGLEERLTSVDARDVSARADREKLQARLEEEQVARTTALATLEGERQKLVAEERTHEEARRRCSQLEERLVERETQSQTLQNRLNQAEADLAAQKQIVEQTKDIKTSFEASAAKILEKSGNQLSEVQFKQIEATLAPLKGSLGEFKKQVEEAERARQNEQGQLKEQLKNVLDSSAKLSAGAENLTRALKGDNKVAGGWGEFVLDRVLEETGLEKGREYFTQGSKKNEEGKTLRPDVVIRLPEDKCLIVDSKVSLKHWEAFVSEECDWILIENSVRQHMKGLASKNYDDLHGAKSVDYVLMFLPIEPLFLELARRSPALLKEAWEKRVMFVGPSTLQWALRSVNAIWKFEHQNKNAQEIARQAGAMYDKFVHFLEDMEDINKHLTKAQLAYDGAFNKLKGGKGNLIVSAQKLTKLGARTKKELPMALVEDAALEVPRLN